ncbi:MAG: serine hydrolase [Pseudomonadota bacterium]
MAMTWVRFGLLAGSAAAMAACAPSYQGADSAGDTAPLAAVEFKAQPEVDPSEQQVLFWDDATRSARFRDMESWFAGHEVPAATSPRALPQGEPLAADLQAQIQKMMADTNAAGVMVLQDGKVRFEEYALGLGKQDRWTSFSVAKSFTSTLLAAAISDGFIGGLEDPVTQYIPELKGSSYDGVTVGQLVTMTSGVAWNEDYTDPQSDVAQLNKYVVDFGPNAIVEQMKQLGRANEPGTTFSYSTGETNLIGLLIENAIGLPMAEYAQTKIVEPAGFEGGMFWMTDPRGGNIGGCCLSLRLADYARMGQFALEGGEGVVPDGWFIEAGSPKVQFGGGFGYGYQWWTYPGANYGAQGIFGQAITVIPSTNTVIAVVSNWPMATSDAYRAQAGGIVFRLATPTN